MEAVGFVASIMALIEAANTLFEYVKDVKDGPSDRAELQRSLASLPSLLAGLKAQFENTAPGDSWSTETCKLAAKDGPFDQLSAIFKQIETKLQIPATRTAKIIKTLKWTLDKADIADLLLKVERVKTFIMLAIQNDLIALSREIHEHVQGLIDDVGKVTDDLSLISDQVEGVSAGVKQIQAHAMSADLRAFSEWLSPLNFQATQDSFVAKSAPGTGDWFLANTKFQCWTAGHIKILWCPGAPGAGKTMLASRAIAHLNEQVLQPGVGVACIFFDYNQSTSQRGPEIIGSVLRQLLVDSSIPQSLESFHAAFKANKSLPTSLTPFMVALQGQLQLYSRVYLVVDALDESSERMRDDFLFNIRSLTESGHLHVLITSRDIPSITHEFVNDSCIKIWAHEDDVQTYISLRIQQERRLKSLIRGDLDLKNEIVLQVTEKAAGMFLLVRLHLDSLASKHNRKALREGLVALPKDIYQSYDDTMDRISTQGEDDANLAHEIFLWLTFSKEPLSLLDLQYAIAITPGMTDMDTDAITDADCLIAVCAGLIQIVWDDVYGKSCVFFVHYTTQEYFKLEASQKHFQLPETQTYFKLPQDLFFQAAHFHIAMTCITYLLFESLMDVKEADIWHSQPLLSYSGKYWGDHVRVCEDLICTNPKACELLLRLLKDRFDIKKVRYIYMEPPASLWCYMPSAIHVVAGFGLVAVMTTILDHGIDLDSLDGDGQISLHNCVEKEDLMMLKLLVKASLERGCFDPNHIFDDGDTLLHIAAIHNSRPEITQFLLKFPQINPDSRRLDGRTPLSCAAEAGHTEIVNVLVQQQGIDPNSRCGWKQTPLLYAIEEGHLEIIKNLLQLPNINTTGPDGETLICYASGAGHVEVVDFLLRSSDIDPNVGGPLWYAAEGGRWKVVQLLMEHPRILPATHIQNSDGMTLLMFAARNRGDPEIVHHLLDDWHVEPDRKDQKGRTALSHASEWGHGLLVEILLSRPDVDPNSQDYVGRKSLSYASGAFAGLIDESINLEVVKLLLEHPDIQPNKPDERGMTPLMYAAKHAPESIFHLLFNHPLTDASLRDQNGNNLLMCAIRDNISAVRDDSPVIIRHLLNNSVDVRIRDEDLYTALHRAARRGSFNTVEILLEHGVDINVRDRYSRTPLCLALQGAEGAKAGYYWIREGCEEVAKLLVEHGAIHGGSHLLLEPLDAEEFADIWNCLYG
ncbi:ankyrin repeat-containing domain protein [Mycena floridula]|nr:ankyrin repeat-containing domain protein [Mycena floridula]